MGKITRIRDLKTDLKARIERATQEEGRLMKRLGSLAQTQEDHRACVGQLAMLQQMLEQAEKNQPRMEGTEEIPVEA